MVRARPHTPERSRPIVAADSAAQSMTIVARFHAAPVVAPRPSRGGRIRANSEPNVRLAPPPVCSICLECCTTATDETMATTGCKHLYHRSCIRQWSNQCLTSGAVFSCPACRAVLNRDFSLASVEETLERRAHLPDELWTRSRRSVSFDGGVSHDPWSYDPATTFHPLRDFRFRYRNLGTHYLDLDLAEAFPTFLGQGAFVDLDCLETS